MKRIYFLLAGLSMLVFISCGKDSDSQLTPPVMASKEKILGAWKLDKSIEKYYEPVNTLVDQDEYIGEPGDSVVFRSDNVALGYEPGYSQDPEMFEYHIKGSNTISIDDEDYRITKLTESALHLYIEYIEDDTKWTQAIFLYR
jgi:hypothetical protein